VDPSLARGSGSTSNAGAGFETSVGGAEGGQGKKRRMEDDLHEHGLVEQDHDRLGGQGGGYPDTASGLDELADQQEQVRNRADASMTMSMGMEVTMDQATRDGHTDMNATTTDMGNGMDVGGNGGGTGGSGGEEGAEGAESGGDK